MFSFTYLFVFVVSCSVSLSHGADTSTHARQNDRHPFNLRHWDNQEEHRCGAILTYLNSAHQDGAGAQLQRILSAFVSAKALGLGYVHTPLDRVGWQGIGASATGLDTRAQDKWNVAFDLPNFYSHGCADDLDAEDGCGHVKMTRPSIEDAKKANALACKGDTRLVIHVAYPFTLVDEDTSLLEHVTFADYLPWLNQRAWRRGESRPLRIAVHIRRGELLVVFSDRMLPNSYYIKVCLMIGEILSSFGIPYEFEIHTEQPLMTQIVKDTNLGGKEVGIISPNDTHLEDFDVLSPKRMRLNEDPLETMKSLATADIFVMSRSSFSYTAALLHTRNTSMVLYHSFWHKPRRDWLVVKPSSSDTEFQHENYEAVRDYIMQRFAKVRS